MYGIANKPVTLVTQQVTSEGDVERITTAKKDISSTSSSDGNAAQKIVQQKLVTRAEKLAMTSESWKPTLRSPESVTLRSSQQPKSQAIETNSTMSGGKTQSSTYSLTQVLATLAVKLGDSTVVGQMFRATATQLMGSATSAALIQKSQDVENAQQTLTQANLAYSEAVKTVNEADDHLLQAETSLNNAEQSLNNALNILTSSETAYNDALNAIYSNNTEKTLAIKTAADRMTSAQQAVDVASDKCQQAIDVKSKAQTAANDATENAQEKQQAVVTATQMLKVAQDTLGNATVSTRNVNNDNTGSINRVDLMMAQLVTILGKCNEETLKTNMELAKSQQSAKQAELAKETEKSDKIAEKQKRMHKIFGILGKVIMSVMMVAGAISALFTGGVMAILFIASTTLMISDQITKAATGESFMAKAMNAVVSGFAKMFEAMGANELVASILASITMLLTTIAAMVVLGGGAKLLGNKFAGNMTNSILRGLSNHGESGVGSAIKMWSKYTFRTSLAASGINNGAYSITSGVYEQQRDNISARLLEIMKDNDFVKRFMDIIVENYSNTMKTMNAIITNETEEAGMSMQVGKQILAHTRA
ncbi:TPA: YopB/SseC family type III secretion system translocon subunit [Citrobacter freundii]|uniref:Pathogenicity island 1 effector protein SipB n=2 Tax=Citrobacter TaxID=544 RepID=A0A212I9V7_9ENTR|nr:type III secretion system translocon subunit SctE [Citrobacter freundii]AOI31036.1 pathogenicity island 1 effector protein SipB [Citrobacter freundii]EKQ7210958.1 type III secretion system translocon subunit SctE [Citrobacter freundii]KKJ87175.1 pathogenicity island 1 effector protein SipB [Citrobacter freundii]MBJ9533511.1 type III secretion system translocon subunit SctE [Citrobacter freundii]MDK7601533.1 type III secretion system translocon subunit SctE [Citrobacter freundii]